MQKPSFDCVHEGRRSCFLCDTEDVAYMFHRVRILGNDVCWSCEHTMINKCFTESWSDRNPFSIWVLLGFILQNRGGAIHCDNVDEPRMWLKNVAMVKLNGGLVIGEKSRVVDIAVRFPLTGIYSYGNIIEHYPEVKALFEGQQDG